MKKLPGGLVQVFRMAAEDFGRLDRQGAVQVDRHVLREPSILGKEVERVDDFLGSLNGEGRDDHLLLPGIAESDGVGKLVQALGFIFMVPVPVSRFQEKRIGPADLGWVFDQELGGQLGAVDAAFGALDGAVKANEGIGDAIEAANETLVALGETFARREAIIKGTAE